MTSFLWPPLLNPRHDAFVLKCIEPCTFNWQVVRKDILHLLDELLRLGMRRGQKCTDAEKLRALGQ